MKLSFGRGVTRPEVQRLNPYFSARAAVAWGDRKVRSLEPHSNVRPREMIITVSRSADWRDKIRLIAINSNPAPERCGVCFRSLIFLHFNNHWQDHRTFLRLCKEKLADIIANFITNVVGVGPR